MSNTIQNMVRRVARMKPTERQVLVQLADDARDHLGGRSRLTTADLCQRTDLSERTIRRAYAALVEAGHITREPGPLGSATVTLVHPNLANAKAAAKNICPDQVWPPSAVPLAAGTGQSGRPPLREEDIKPITHTPRERAHEDFSGSGEGQKEAAGLVPPAPAVPEPETPALAAPDPVAAVFDAWDAMNLASGLPGGPVVRDMARRVAVDRKLREGDLPQLLAVIAKVGETVRAGGMRKRAAPGQSDIFATFDAVFEIGHAAGLRLFTRLLDGQEWGKIGTRPDPTPPPPKGQAMGPNDIGEPPEITRLRQLLHDKLGGRTYANWIEGLRFEKDPAGALRVFAKTPFMVDRVRSDHGHQIGVFARSIWPNCDEVLFGLARVQEQV